MLKKLSKAKHWWIDHPRFDFTLSAAGFTVLLLPWDAATVLAVGEGVAGLAGVILGMGAVVLGLMQQSTGARIKTFRALYGEQLKRNWTGILMGCAIAAVLALTGAAVHQVSMLVAQALIGYALAHTAIRALRLAWLTTFYMGADHQDSAPDLQLRSEFAKGDQSHMISP